MRHIKTTGTITALNTYPVSLWDKPVTKVEYNLSATIVLNLAVIQQITGTYQHVICTEVPAHEFAHGTD
jgi:hypothetical protein